MHQLSWNREVVWSFRTKRFTIALEISPEDMDPADSFEQQEDIDAIRNGEVEWFNARVVVSHNGREIGSDNLGGCAYKTIREFYESHRDPDPMNRNSSIMRAARGEKTCICHYFPSMVAQAVADAREFINQVQLKD